MYTYKQDSYMHSFYNFIFLVHEEVLAFWEGFCFLEALYKNLINWFVDWLKDNIGLSLFFYNEYFYLNFFFLYILFNSFSPPINTTQS